MIKFQISNDLRLERQWNGRAMCWLLVKSKDQRLLGLVELTDKEVKEIIAKVEQIFQAEAK